MTDRFADYRSRINKLLSNYYGADIPLLNPLKEALFSSSKRVRGILAYLGCGVVGGNIEDADKVAMAYEIITSGYILVDDSKIFDKGKLRGNKPTPRKVYGEEIVALASLVLQAEPIRLLNGNSSLGDLFYESAYNTILGEFYDQKLSENPTGKPEDPNYIIEIARLKTGSLLSGALVSGAIVGKGKELEISALIHYGMDLGTAYQISDHVLDIIGNEQDTGKDSFSDVKTKKKSTVINHALSSLLHDSQERKFLLKSLGTDLSEEEKIKLRKILVDSGSVKYAYDLVFDYNKRSISHLEYLNRNNYKELLSHIPELYTEPLEKVMNSQFFGK